MNNIECFSLKKSFNKGKALALSDVSFNVEKGEIFGIIGPDGAGKTTLFRILTTLLIPDYGRARVLDLDTIKDFREIRRNIGYMPGKFSLYQDLSVEENLSFYATLFNASIEENFELIRDIYVQIQPFKKRRAGNLSGGMKQKLALCCALIHKPKVLFLDEPTTGIDPVSRIELWDMLHKLKKHGISIMVSTPYMDEAMRCDRIAMMQLGKVMRIGQPEKIISDFNKNLVAIKTNNMHNLLKSLKDCEYVKNSYAFGEYAHAIVDDNFNLLEDFLNKIGLKNIEITKVKPTIEDVFIDELKQIAI